MTQTEVTLVRVYCTEQAGQHQRIVDLLHRQHRIAGVTAFRGIIGFGRSGKIHEAGLLDASLDLPVTIEFFDRPQKVAEVLPLIYEIVGQGHVVSWAAKANLD